MKLIDVLLSEYATNSKIKKLVDSLEIYIIPMVNPDGVYASSNTSCTGGTRANANGVDLNRNYPDIVGGGKKYELENKITIEFDTSHNFTFCLDFHSGGEAVGYPYASRKKQAPDSLWYAQEGKRHASAVQALSSNYFKDFGGKGYGNAYLMLPDVQGTRVDYLAFYCHCLSYGFELSKNKQMSEGQWLTYWDYHKESILDDYASALFGIRGTVTDAKTGKGVKAKIFINDQKNDSSHVYTNMPFGDYYRPSYRGTYSITVASNGYKEAKVENIAVKDNAATIVDVKLEPINSALTTILPDVPGFLIQQKVDNISISMKGDQSIKSISLYDLSGKEAWSKVFDTDNQTCFLWNRVSANGSKIASGCYIMRVQTSKSLYCSQTTVVLK
jgi:hypothetical protein